MGKSRAAVRAVPARLPVMAAVGTAMVAAAVVQLTALATGSQAAAPAACQQVAAWRFSVYAPGAAAIATVPATGAPVSTPTFSDAAPPAWSPDGRLATYDLDAGRFVIHDASGAVVGGFASAVSPTPIPNAGTITWSPDSTRFSYSGPDGIYVTRADGTGAPVRIADENTSSSVSSTVRWSPDSTRLSWALYSTVFVGSSDGSAPVTVWSGGEPAAWAVTSTPQWSPDGSTLAWTGNGSLFTAPASGAPVTTVTVSGHTALDEAAWSPDGSRLAMLGTAADGTRRLVTTSPAGTGALDITPTLPALPPPVTTPIVITPVRWELERLAWSPDGSRVAYELRLIVEGSSYFQDRFVIGWTDAAGDIQQTVVEASSTWSLWFRWSPDGTRLAYSSDTSGLGVGTIQTSYVRVGASVVNDDGTGATQLPEFGYQPEWNPVVGTHCGGTPPTTTTSTTVPTSSTTASTTTSTSTSSTTTTTPSTSTTRSTSTTTTSTTSRPSTTTSTTVTSTTRPTTTTRPKPLPPFVRWLLCLLLGRCG